LFGDAKVSPLATHPPTQNRRRSWPLSRSGPSGIRHEPEPARIIGAAFRATESSGYDPSADLLAAAALDFAARRRARNLRYLEPASSPLLAAVFRVSRDMKAPDVEFTAKLAGFSVGVRAALERHCARFTAGIVPVLHASHEAQGLALASQSLPALESIGLVPTSSRSRD